MPNLVIHCPACAPTDPILFTHKTVYPNAHIDDHRPFTRIHFLHPRTTRMDTELLPGRLTSDQVAAYLERAFMVPGDGGPIIRRAIPA